jgi:lysophospholipase L1-like esterase
MICSSFVKKLATPFLFIFCTLLCVEVLLRVLGAAQSRQSPVGRMGGGNVFNIVCLGDSFTYGWGVDPDFNYPRQLERMLNSARLGREFKVYNLAVPGSNSSQHFKYLKGLMTKYNKPDLVIILTGTNDSWNLADSNIFKVAGTRWNRVQLMMYRVKYFFADFRIYKTVKLLALNLKGKTPESETDLFSQAPQKEDIRRDHVDALVEYNLTGISTLLRTNDVKLILQNYPTGDISRDRVLEKTAKALGIPFVDNCANFNAALERVDFRDLFLYDNSHPTAAGYTIMADALFKVIVSRFLDTRGKEAL